ncbi:hypothetical protein O181_106569 [Austropuccinia psidii MF-1]|uniref:Uncharacterized protein n=1 Tax=Austropuccinia psidii MF-1 TaxID=1389203 RepID=A0A9Q3PM69_9BASI|nr:hypothetical protein [Austropuccinia psidii MF-1]
METHWWDPQTQKCRREKGIGTAKALYQTKGTSIATQRTRKPANSESIQDKPTLIMFTGKITIIDPVVTSEGKFPKAADNTFVQETVKGKYPKNKNVLDCLQIKIFMLYTSGAFESQQISQRIDKHCSEPEDQGV